MPDAMTVAGIMSGTSADGIDVAIVRIECRTHASGKNQHAGRIGHAPRLTLLAHEGFPFAASLRRTILAAMNASLTSTA